MSIIVKLDDLLHERRMTLTELSGKIGITLANLSVLNSGASRVSCSNSPRSLCPRPTKWAPTLFTRNDL
jgi:putative transcriptional regulator